MWSDISKMQQSARGWWYKFKDINYSLTSLAEINKNSFSSVCVCGFFFFGYCRVIQSKDTKYSHCDNKDRIRTLNFLTWKESLLSGKRNIMQSSDYQRKAPRPIASAYPGNLVKLIRNANSWVTKSETL